MTYGDIQERAARHHLIVMGTAEGDIPYPAARVVLLGTGPGFWDVFRKAPEFQDGKPDALDRWSKRIIEGLANELSAGCCFPSDGPPYPPFIRWALQSGRCFSSPVGMLVHDTVGMMISFRGALLFQDTFPVPKPAAPSPCLSCADRPCGTACPVAALSDGQPYEVPACHAYLDSAAGTECMTQGCAARRACPLSAGAERDPKQSAFHMRAFHPA